MEIMDQPGTDFGFQHLSGYLVNYVQTPSLLRPAEGLEPYVSSTSESSSKKKPRKPVTKRACHQCKNCGNFFTRRDAVVRHQRLTCWRRGGKKAKQETYSCKIRSLRSDSESGLKEHDLQHKEHDEIMVGENQEESDTKESLFWCLDCGNVFTTKGNLVRHKKSSCYATRIGNESSIEKWQEPLIEPREHHSKYFGNSYTRRDHVLRHEQLTCWSIKGGKKIKQQTYSFKLPSQKSDSESGLEEHELQHKGHEVTMEENQQEFETNKTVHQCLDCGNFFTMKRSLIRHQQKSCWTKRTGNESHIEKWQEPLLQPKQYDCKHCGKSYTRRDHVIRHQRLSCYVMTNRTHNQTNKQDQKLRHHHCEHCGKSFVRRFSLVQHQQQSSCLRKSWKGSKMTEQETFWHKTANQKFDSNRTLKKPNPEYKKNGNKTESKVEENKQEKKSSIQSINHQCEHCGKSFLRLDHLVRHKQQNKVTRSKTSENTKQEMYSCTQCSEQFSVKCCLTTHMHLHKENKAQTTKKAPQIILHTCSHCDKSFYTVFSFQQHLRLHTGQKLFHCEVCGEKFARKGSLEEHMMVHSEEKQFQDSYPCEKPSQTIDSKKDLKEYDLRNKRNGRNAEEPITEQEGHQCSVCGTFFAKRHNLIRHQRESCSTTGRESFIEDLQELPIKPREHQCKHCGKSFTRRQHLFRHQQLSGKNSENTKQMYQCNQCSEQFNFKCSLTMHMRHHKGDNTQPTEEVPKMRLYSCSHCDKTFYTVFSLRQHLRLHTGEKLFHCEVCGKKFARKGSLEEHMVVHSEQKQCQKRDSCKNHSQKFGTKRDLEYDLPNNENGQNREEVGEDQQEPVTKLKRNQHKDGGNFFARRHNILQHLRRSCSTTKNRKQKVKENRLEPTVKPRPHRCRHCQQSFVRRDHLLRHQRQNSMKSGENSENTKQIYRCNQCNRKFDIKCCLKMHMRHHKKTVREAPKAVPRVITCSLQHHLFFTEEKRYHCEVCGNKFAREGDLQEHMVLHSISMTTDSPLNDLSTYLEDCFKTAGFSGETVHLSTAPGLTGLKEEENESPIQCDVQVGTERNFFKVEEEEEALSDDGNLQEMKTDDQGELSVGSELMFVGQEQDNGRSRSRTVTIEGPKLSESPTAEVTDPETQNCQENGARSEEEVVEIKEEEEIGKEEAQKVAERHQTVFQDAEEKTQLVGQEVEIEEEEETGENVEMDGGAEAKKNQVEKEAEMVAEEAELEEEETEKDFEMEENEADESAEIEKKEASETPKQNSENPAGCWRNLSGLQSSLESSG